MAVRPMTLEFPVSPGDTIYEIRYMPCHNGESFTDSQGCFGCKDECDLKKEIIEFSVPNIDWVLSHYRYADIRWFTSKEKAEIEFEK